MSDREDTTKRFSDQPEWAVYLVSRLEALATSVGELRTEVAQIRDRLDARDRETRPLNETLEGFRIELRELREGQRELREEQKAMREEMNTEFRRLHAKFRELLDRHFDLVAISPRSTGGSPCSNPRTTNWSRA